MNTNRITLRAFILGTLFSGIFAAVTVYFTNREGLPLAATQIAVLPYALLICAVLLINPVCKFVRVLRCFSVVELLIVFTMCMVSGGIASFGLSAEVIPIAGSLFNKSWNNEQSKWNVYVEPFVNDSFFLANDGIREAAADYREKVLRLSRARQEYETALREGKSAPSAETLEHHARQLALYERATSDAEARLAGLEDEAFARVRVFRRGLPRELRAFPGIFPLENDTVETYAERVRRLIHGSKSLGHLSDAGAAVRGGDMPAARQLLTAASEALAPVSEGEALATRRNAATEDVATLGAQSASLAEELRSLNDAKRSASRKESADLASRIKALNKDKRAIDRQQGALIEAMEAMDRLIGMSERVAATRASITALAQDIESEDPVKLEARLEKIMGAYGLFDASVTRFLAGDIPWRHWARPLLGWGLLIVLTYLMLMTFNVLIFRQWAYNEKLVYPLAQLPEHLAGAGGADGVLPAVFRNGLFWAGFSISTVVLGWNLVCHLGVVPGLTAIQLVNKWKSFIVNSPLEGLRPYSRSEIFFTMIGLSFLIPRKISFSLWFFWIVYFAQQLILVWTGHGVNQDSFKMDPWTLMNFRTAEGGGALLVFGCVVLFKCRRYILCGLMPGTVAELDPDERKELRISSLLFLASFIGIILTLWQGMGANLPYAVFSLIVILLITIALIRVVTEGGILGFQAWASPFHYIRTVFGMNKAWTAPSLMAPLLVYYSVFFFDIKTFIAPAMANALKIRDDLKMRRWRFHTAILAAILIAVVVSLATELMLAYSTGADRSSGWFYTGLPEGLFKRITSLGQNPPPHQPVEAVWFGAGAVIMAALLYFRQFFFSLPHPIGLIMLVNPLMTNYWFSIFLGWAAKALVNKYGNKDLYARTRGFFLGLIVGELTLVVVSVICSQIFEVSIPIDLNRNP